VTLPAVVAVCGASEPTPEQERAAEEVGRLLAARRVAVVCGGLGGVMSAAARGVREGGGICVGLLPGDHPNVAAPELTVALATGMGEMRNALLARVAAGMIAVGGGYGTLSEIALARRMGRPVALVQSWDLGEAVAADQLLHVAADAGGAVDWILDRLRPRK